MRKLPKRRPKKPPKPTSREFRTRGRILSKQYSADGLSCRDIAIRQRIEKKIDKWEAWEMWPALKRSEEQIARMRAIGRRIRRRLVKKYAPRPSRPPRRIASPAAPKDGE